MAVTLGFTPVSLLDRLRASREEPDWDRFVLIYRELIRTWLARAGIVPADLDDLQQEVMVALLRAVPKFEHNGRTGAFRRWLKVLVIQRVLNFCRSRRRVLSIDATDSDEVATLKMEDRMLTASWEREHDEYVLRKVMALVEPEFTVSTWTAFTRHVLQDQRTADVAKELGLTMNAVLIAKSRVLKRLREEAAGLVD